MDNSVRSQIQNLINTAAFKQRLSDLRYGHVEFVVRDGKVYNVLFVHSVLVRPEDRDATAQTSG